MSNGPQEQYTDEMHDHFGYYATWTPGLKLNLGDIGILNGNAFTRLANIKDKGLTFLVGDGGVTNSNIAYSSSGSVTVSFKASGSASSPGSALTSLDAGIIIDFGKQYSTYFQADGTSNQVIEDTITLGDQIIEKFKNGEWDKHWVVITEVITISSGSIIISNSNNAKIELKANGNVGLAKIDIADPSLDLSVQFARDIHTQIIATDKQTPLFKVMGISKPIFSSPVFKPELALETNDFHAFTPESAKSEHAKIIEFSEV